MSADATGAPTSPDSIPKFNTATDIANGKGINQMMDAVQVLFSRPQIRSWPIVPWAGTYAAATANTAYMVEFPLAAPHRPTTMATYNNGAAAGSIDMSIYYTDDRATFTRAISCGGSTTVLAGNNLMVPQGFPTITPAANRSWWLAFWCNSATPTWPVINTYALSSSYESIFRAKAGAVGGLTSTMTGMTVAAAGFHVFGVN